MANQLDFKNAKGEWVHRAWVGEKYTYTISGMLWNNIKERGKIGGGFQERQHTYRGTTNLFEGFQQFTDWHIGQVGYGLGYQLDADMLLAGTKCYSEDTCLLIPPALNKFLQSSAGHRGEWPQGVYISQGRLHARCGTRGATLNLGNYSVTDVEKARSAYKVAKDGVGREWAERLASSEFTVDARAIEYMRKWEHICDWTPA